jgi:hypothetical protein
MFSPRDIINAGKEIVSLLSGASVFGLVSLLFISMGQTSLRKICPWICGQRLEKPLHITTFTPFY